MESFLHAVLSYLSYLAHHLQDLASCATVILVLLTLRQLRGAKLNTEVALEQLKVAREQAIAARSQEITARGQQKASTEAVDQQKRAARTAEEVKLDSQAPDLAVFEYGPVVSRVGGHQRWSEVDYDWVFSEENSLALPERFSITPGGDYFRWTIWVTGSLLIRNEGSRTVLLGPVLSHRWVGDPPPKSGNSEYIVSPGEDFMLEWFNIYTLENWRRDALGTEDSERLGVDQKSNTMIIISPHLPELHDIWSIQYAWYPVRKAFGSDNKFLFFDRPPVVVIKKRRCYPTRNEE